MAVAYITEYAELGRDNNARTIPVGQEPPVATQTVSIGGSSTQSAAFNSKTAFIRVHVDAICSLSFGANPTADASSPRMAANTTEFFGVRDGQKLAVISNT